MASILNSHGGLKNDNVGDGEDWISSLPESILVHILSFLPTKCVIRTSILSTRWKNLWASIPIIVLEDNVVHRNVSSSFMNVVDRVLLFHDSSCIQKFALKFGHGIDMSRLGEWIGVVIRRHIQELDIHIFTRNFMSNYLKLPLDLFTCKTLVVLKLGTNLVLDVPSSIYFPSLKTFYISLILPNNDLTQKLFCSCPVLEDLWIEGDVRDYEKINFNISTPVLKSLKIEQFVGEVSYFESEIMVKAPVLQYLTVEDNFLVHYMLSDVGSLVKVDVDVGDLNLEADGGEENAIRAYMLVKKMSNTKFLCLGARTTAALHFTNGFDLPMFPNLTHLELALNSCYSWQILPKFFDSAPNLGILILKKVQDSNFDGDNWIEPEGPPACLFSHLKEIMIIGFEGFEDELGLIKYLLKNADVLNKMTIGSPNLAIEEERKFLKKLLMFPRASRTSQIEFV